MPKNQLDKQTRTINLRNVPPALFLAAKVLAAQRGITLKQLCFEALTAATKPVSKPDRNAE